MRNRTYTRDVGIRGLAGDILETIEQRLGFVPPFFSAAADQPDLLRNLWQQTESAYLDNPLPGLFKEQLAALLARYCAAPYCFVCHTCSLQPLGMRSGAILRFLEAPPVSDREVEASLARLAHRPSTARWFPDHGTELESDIFALGATVYLGGRLVNPARATLRSVLDRRDFNHLVSFVSYNRMCHEWVAAHPDISYELDRRYIDHGGRLTLEAPQIGAMFAEYSTFSPVHREDRDAALHETTLQRAGEAERMHALSELRLHEVLKTLTDRLGKAREETSELRQVRLEAQTTAKFAQELLAIVSHDLRSPLGSILMSATLLERLNPQDERFTRALRRIFSSTQSAQGLIDDLLDFSLARAGGGIPIHRGRTDAYELVRYVAEELEVAYPGRAIEVQSEGDCSGEWDAERIKQVLANLMGNALVHSPDGSTVDVSVSGTDEVMISTRNLNRKEAIRADVLRVMFEPFKRGDVTPASRNRRVGLGLYIVDSIVKAHGGRIVVSSVEKSTTFTVHLPRAGATV